jgi:hypothetical protein
MRQLSPVSNLVLACAAAIGMIGTLGLEWFAPPVADFAETDGPMERTAFAFASVFQHHADGVTGADALGSTAGLVYALAGAVFLLSALAAVPALRGHVRDILRAVALATPLLVGVLAIRHTGTQATLHVHWGLLVALATAAFTASCAWHGSAIRQKRASAGSWERRPAV